MKWKIMLHTSVFTQPSQYSTKNHFYNALYALLCVHGLLRSKISASSIKKKIQWNEIYTLTNSIN